MSALIDHPLDLGRTLAAQREARGMTHADLEAAAGLVPGQARRLETGTAHIGDIDLAAVLRALGLRLVLRERPDTRGKAA